MVRALATGAGGPGFKTQLVHGNVQQVSVHRAVNEYPVLFRAEKVVRERSGASPQLHRCWYKMAL